MAQRAGNPAGARWLRWLCAFLLCAVAARAGEVVDRIVAVVDGSIVLQSDLEAALRLEGLAGAEAQVPFSAAQREQALQRLIDQELLRDQMTRAGYAPASPEELKAAVAQLRQTVRGAETEDGWNRALTAAGLSEDDVEDRLAAQIEISRFVDQRFRPGIRIDSAEVRRYYDDTLVPELRAKGVAIPGLEEVAPKIQELLVEKTISDELEGWLKSLRAESKVRILTDDAATEAGGR